ncbi:MAG: iron ABC transporter permease [Aliidiomarina sp.]|uniref:FecCD family ABC transporter permease n=1 Tax=Aliidiomarina sp. TaxID=1872439 RepID=UPI0025BCEE6A|nr:iron ABC transporter permease [Aliidiomarina sp.]MCH8501451.1 iron ABC transporter permease [Aliidiomarina sp.]
MTNLTRHRLVLAGLIAVLLVFGVNVGSSGITLLDLRAESTQAEFAAVILFEIRLPRLFLAALVGAALGLAGAAIQGLLRNPLAEPGILGVSSGGAAAAVIALYFGFAAWHSFALPVFAMFGSGLALFVILWIAGIKAPVTSIILAGIAVTSFCGGVIALALSFAANPFAFQEISYWLLGSFVGRDLQHIYMLLPGFIMGASLLLYSRHYLLSLTLGENVAASMGFSHRRQRLVVLIGLALTTGSAVAVTGIIGFVGLIVPHIVRPFVRNRPDYLLVSSALAGSCLVLLLDLLVQVLPTGPELQVGSLAALLGGPFFLFLLMKNIVRGDIWR